MVAPQSNGSDSNQETYAFLRASGSYRPCSTSVRASVSASSESSVGWPANVSHVPPPAISRTPFGYRRRIALGVWNSTRPPGASPASCPSRQPCARASMAGPTRAAGPGPPAALDRVRVTRSSPAWTRDVFLASHPNRISARSSSSKMRPSSSAVVRPRRPSRQRRGSASSPCSAPTAAPTMAAMVSLSFVSLTARTVASSGSSPYRARMNRTAGTVSSRKAPEYQSLPASRTDRLSFSAEGTCSSTKRQMGPR